MWQVVEGADTRCAALRRDARLQAAVGTARVELHAARLRARCSSLDAHCLTRLACASKPTGDFTSAAATPPKRTRLVRGTSLRAASAGLTLTSWTSQPSWRTWMDQVRGAGAPGRRPQAHTPASVLLPLSAASRRLPRQSGAFATTTHPQARRVLVARVARAPGPTRAVPWARAGAVVPVRGCDESHAPGSAACSRAASLPGLCFCSDAADRGIRGASQDSPCHDEASKSPLAPSADA